MAQIVTREVHEITREDAESLVAENVEREGFEFFLMVNKSAALFRRGEELGLVLGQHDGVQMAESASFNFVLFRAPTTIYYVGGLQLD